MEFRINNAGFTYPGKSKLLNDISLKVNSGELLCVLGQNGTGKTTLLKCMTGILRWNEGTMILDGKSITSYEISKMIGYVPQFHAPSFPYTVEEMVLMGRARYVGLFSMPTKQDYSVVWDVLELLEISDLAHAPCNCLSGGQLQLVYLARALASDPKLIILDEPEAHLDYKNQQRILRLIKQTIKSRGLMGIINTHYPEHALKYSENVLFLGKGRSVFGKTNRLITESNLRDYFEIETKIMSMFHEGRTIHSVVAL